MAPTSDWLTAQQERIVLKDARIRAIRSFMWGLFLDVSAFVLVILATAFTNIEWTANYWRALGLLLIKTVLQSAVAYTARRLFPPSNAGKL
jgi:hypothetical protein